MERYKPYFKESTFNLLLFSDLDIDTKIKRLSEPPYHKGLYYHVTSKNNYKNIIQHGIKGEEIWVSKDQPHKEYDTGILFELNLSNYTLREDPRWKKEYQTYILDDVIIKPKDILRVFDYFEELSMREDILALKVNKKSKEAIQDIIEEYNL